MLTILELYMYKERKKTNKKLSLTISLEGMRNPSYNSYVI